MRRLPILSLLLVLSAPGCSSGPQEALVILRTERADEFARYLGSDVPIGTLCLVVGKCDRLPNGWLVCTGQTLSRGEYPELGERVGDRLAAGSTNSDRFALPDLHGAFVFDFSKILPWWLKSGQLTHSGMMLLSRDIPEETGLTSDPADLAAEEGGPLANEVRWVVKAR